jgi:hypothetical protein
MAHELGHNLGAPHDGKNCQGQDNYLMTPGWNFSETNSVNMKTFSKCSISEKKQRVVVFEKDLRSGNK